MCMLFKNLTPRQVAGINAFTISAIVSVAIFFFVDLWWIALISFVVLFIICFLLVNFFLQQFIYRKIKLIYKFIYQTKASKREETYYKYILPQKSIDEVKDDVEKWADQKRNEIELLKENETYRKEFLQNLAHELKTPIFAIQGYVNTLLDGAMADETVSIRFLEKANRNVERMVSLVNDLDEISRLESGEQPLYKQNFIVHNFIKEVYESLSYLAEEKGINFSFKKGTEQDIVVFADKEKIRQVFINLIENAIKYGKKRGSITASIYRTDGKYVLIEISDDGLGISEEHLPRIFERFYRTDAARSRKIGGSGLGLAICKHIIEAHGQSFHVRSTEDVGTTFGFVLEGRKD